jgi:hypothetical protein
LNEDLQAELAEMSVAEDNGLLDRKTEKDLLARLGIMKRRTS